MRRRRSARALAPIHPRARGRAIAVQAGLERSVFPLAGSVSRREVRQHECKRGPAATFCEVLVGVLGEIAKRQSVRGAGLQRGWSLRGIPLGEGGYKWCQGKL